MSDRGSPGPRLELHLLWIAPLLSVAGLVSYFTFFVRWPSLRDTAWLNLGIGVVAVGLSLWALRAAWRRRWPWRVAGVAGALVSVAAVGLLVAYTQFISYGLPSTEGVVAVGEGLPDLTLQSYDGTPVDLARAAQEPMVLVFYRGFW